MRTSGRASLAIYYYTFAEDQKKDLRGLLSSVIYQLCDQSDSYYNILFNFYSAHRDGTESPADHDLVGCFKELLRNPGPLPIYLIIDGLDECPSTSAQLLPRKEVLSLLEDLVEENFKNLRICVTSRPETDIEAILKPLASLSVSLHQEGGQNEDIRKYIESFVTNDRNMKNWNLEYRRLVINGLTNKADGM
jgi:NACHT domain